MTDIHVYHVSLNFFRLKNGSDRSCRDNQNTFFVQSLLSKIMPFMRRCEKKHCRHGEATDDNMAHAHWMLES